MSLSDLKKSTQAKTKQKNFTVDEFIADAENYAKGHPEIVKRGEQQTLNLTQALAATQQFEAKKRQKNKTSSKGKPFRHATFTLSEEAILQLQDLALKSNLAKSHIIRILIDELCHRDQREKLTRLFTSKIG
jgi:hypothetical protein